MENKNFYHTNEFLFSKSDGRLIVEDTDITLTRPCSFEWVVLKGKGKIIQNGFRFYAESFVDNEGAEEFLKSKGYLCKK